MAEKKTVFEGGLEYRVFKEVIDLENGESIELPDRVIPLTVEPKTPTAVYLWFLSPVNSEDDKTNSEKVGHKPASTLRDETDVLGGDLEI